MSVVRPRIQYFAPISADSRVAAYPIGRPEVYNMYQKAVSSFWTVGEVLLTKDLSDYMLLTAGERHFVNYILAFFASADKLVNDNLTENFIKEVDWPEAKWFYNIQVAMEDIHSEMYSLLLYTIIPSEDERNRLLEAAKHIRVITAMTEYIEATTVSPAPLPERLLRMACVEGLFFTGCFAAIYWLASRNLMPGLAHSNELISRDESQHTAFSLYLYSMLEPQYRLSQERAEYIIRDAVAIGGAFITDALPLELPEMNAPLMVKYIETQADLLSRTIGYGTIYGSTANLPFMNAYNYPHLTNFFERKVSVYKKPIHNIAAHMVGARDADTTVDETYDPDF